MDTLKSGVSFRVLRFSRRHLRGEPLGMAEDVVKRDWDTLENAIYLSLGLFFYSIKRNPLHEKHFGEGVVTGGLKS